MVYQTAEIDNVDVDFPGQGCIADLFLDGDSFGNFEMVYCMEGEVIDGLQGFHVVV
jgi:hypothetical protein